MDIVFRVLEALKPLVEGFPGDAKVLGSQGGILSGSGVVKDHPFHSQSFLGIKTRKLCCPPPEFISILAGNGLSLKEVEAG